METINIKVNKVTEEDFEIKLPFYGRIVDSLVAIENDTFETWYSNSPDYISSRFMTGLSKDEIFEQLDNLTVGRGNFRITSDDIEVISRNEFLARRAELYNQMIRV